MRAWWLFVIPFWLVGCIEEQVVRLPSHLTESVQVSRSEPEGHCRPLGAIEAHSGDMDYNTYESAYERLRSNAALRGGNYVVIDAVNTSAVIQGRLFNCSPISTPPPTVVSTCVRNPGD
jgi:hypothetical protein